MIPLHECAAIAGLKSDDLVVGTDFRPIHWKMLSGYLTNRDKGLARVCGLIIADMRAYLDLGAKEKAADALVVLRLLLANFPSLDTSTIPEFAWSNPSSELSSLQLEMAPPKRSDRLS